MRRLVPLLATATLGLTACATGMGSTGPTTAPQPAKSIDVAKFYTGTWHEVARNPMKITDGCVAGITAFSRGQTGKLIDRDSCRMGDPDTGKEKVFEGPVEILNSATNAKFTTHYKVFGPVTVSRTYWILDHDDNWFITVTPDMKNASVFTRDPHIGVLERGRIVDRLKAMGYQGLLEYPAQPKS